MKIAVKMVMEIVEKLGVQSDRAKYLSPLLQLFSPVSKKTLRDFQDSWDGTKSFDDFVAAQNSLIKDCLTIELSSFGAATRQALDQPSLTEQTEIEIDN